MNRFIWFIPFILAVFALISLSVRMLFPHIDFYKDELAGELSKVIALPVTVGAIESYIRGYTPLVAVSDVTIGDSANDEFLHFARLEFELDIWRSLLARQVVVQSLIAESSQLDFVRSQDGAMHLSGILAAFTFDGDRIPIRLPEILFLNTRLRWHNQTTGKRYLLLADRLQFISNEQRHYVEASVHLPEELGKRLNFTADFNGILNQPDTWTGRFYLQSKAMIIDEWLSAVSLPLGYAGNVEVSIWGNIDSQEQAWVAGSIHCSQCVSPYWEKADFSGSFYGERDHVNWRVALSDVALNISTFRLQEASFVFRKKHESPLFDYAIELPHFTDYHIDSLYPLLELEKHDKQVSLQSESGTLSIVARAVSPRISAFNEKDFMFELARAVQSIQYLHGKLRMQKAQFSLPQWRQEFDEISATVRFAQSGDDRVLLLDRIALTQDGAQLGGSAGWIAGENDSGHLKAGVDINNFPLSRTSQWVPHNKIHPKLSEWLKRAFVRGNLSRGRIEIDGKLAEFPFVDSNGRLSFTADLRGMEINYRKQRKPFKNVNARLMINGTSLLVTVSDLDYYSMHSSYATARINNVLRPYLEVEASADGPLEDIIAYALQAKLIDQDSLLMQSMDFFGNVGLKLSVGAPLRKTVDRPATIDGVIYFDHASIAIPDLGLEFAEIKGNLNFDATGGQSDRLTAVVDSLSLTASAQPTGDGTILSMRGGLPSRFFTDRFPQKWQSYFDGTSLWEAQVTIPNPRHAKREGEELALQMQSDLMGTAVSLPSPFLKSADEKRLFKLEFQANNQGGKYRIRYGDFSGNFEYRNGELTLAHVRFGNGEPLSTNTAYSVGGKIRQTVLIDQWLRLKEQTEGMLSPLYIDLDFNRLVWGGNDFGRSRINVNLPTQRHWQAEVSSTAVQGKISSLPLPDQEYLKADMDYVLLPDSDIFDGLSGKMKLDSVPIIEVSAQKFQYGDIEGEDLRLITSKRKRALFVDDLSFNASSVLVSLQGKWQDTIAGEMCDFIFSIRGRRYDRLLKLWDISESLQDGEGSLSGRLKWPGSPKDFSVETMTGNIRINLEDGVIRKVKPGITRLFGLVNLQVITRRLSLDFGDVLEEGLAFDTMTGTFVARGGNLHTNNFLLTGPALELTLDGRVGIIARDYDQYMEVIPNLSSGLPVVSALLGGPIAAAVVIIVERIIGLGDEVDKAAALQYKIHGSWDDPKVEFLGNTMVDKFKPKEITNWVKEKLRVNSDRKEK